jgi:hypothetical protein
VGNYCPLVTNNVKNPMCSNTWIDVLKIDGPLIKEKLSGLYL